MDFTELQEFQNRYKSLSTSEMRKELRESNLLRQTIERLYTTYLPTAPKINKGCGNCWEDAMIILLTTTKEKSMNELNRKYLLKSGTFTLRDTRVEGGKIFTNTNLTDEIAEKFLKVNKENIKYFGKFPKSWQKDIAEEKDVEKSPATEQKKASKKKRD